jgi:hypothetical protein
MYQFNPVIESRGIVSYGSDVVTQYEANRADPFFGMQAGHTRIDPEYPMESGPGTVESTSIRQRRSARLSREDLLAGIHAERRDPAAPCGPTRSCSRDESSAAR